MKKTLLITAAILALTTGCDDNDLKSGTVYEKKYTAAWAQTTFVCVAHDKNGACTQQIPQQINHPERFEICIEGTVNSKGRSPHNCIDVPKSEFDKYSKGDHYSK